MAKNKGADQLCSYSTADLHLCFLICKIWFSYDEAHIELHVILDIYIRAVAGQRSSPDLCFATTSVKIYDP